jgi:ATP-dependent HslUV protease ATP-binding subunit HslU
VLERVLDEISFNATDKGGESVVIDGDYVRGKVEGLSKNADLSRFVL